MSQQVLRVGLIGTRFMGKAHSNAWSQVRHFFRLLLRVEKQAICGRDEPHAREMARIWDWRSVETDWRKLIARDDIDLIDICTPNSSHAEIALAALKAGKHVACEKPLCMNLTEARKMARAALAAKDRLNTVWYHYRRIPALALARQFVEQGRLGRIYHIKGAFRQGGHIDPNRPAGWRHDARLAGSGAHADIHSHVIDTARFVSGEEFLSVVAHMETFVTQRRTAEGRKVSVTVDDAAALLGKLSGGGMANTEGTRFAQGRKVGTTLELNGERGALAFDVQDMNRLEFFDATAPKSERGWTEILLGEPEHPYSAYWPVGHNIGYEHAFINQCADIVNAIAENRAAELQPNFADSAKTQAVLDAALASARSCKWEKVRN